MTMTAVISREGYQPTFTILLSSPLFVCVPFFKHEITSSSIRCSTANTKSIMCICMYVSLQARNRRDCHQICGDACGDADVYMSIKVGRTYAMTKHRAYAKLSWMMYHQDGLAYGRGRFHHDARMMDGVDSLLLVT